MVIQRRDGTVEFRFFRPDARQVAIAGDFNGWHQASMPMTRSPDGWWWQQARLDPGCYQFRYVSDGEWYTDFAAFGIEQTPLGLNSVLKIDASPIAPAVSQAPPAVVRFPHISELARNDEPVDAIAAVADRPIRTPATIPVAVGA